MELWQIAILLLLIFLRKNHKKFAIDTNMPEFDTFRNMSSKEIIKSLSIPYYKLQSFVLKIRKLLKEEIESINIISEISDILLELSKENNLMIVTSNSEENVKYFCVKFNINCFSKISTEKSLFGKADTIKKIIKKDNVKYEKMFYIGDETRDIEAAKKAGIQSIAVSWGYSVGDILKKYKPDYIIDNPKELLYII